MKQMVVGAAAVLGVLLLGIGYCFADTFQIYATEDSWVNQANPEVVYASNSYLSVKDRSGSAQSFIRFSNDALKPIAGLRIEAASLWMYQYQATYSPGDVIGVHGVTQDWSAAALSWSNKPLFADTAACSLNFSEGNECWREFKGMESLMTGWYGGGNYGVCLENDMDGQANELFARFYSSEAALEKRPYLLVSAQGFGGPIATPEPVSAALFAVGGLLLSVARKRGGR